MRNFAKTSATPKFVFCLMVSMVLTCAAIDLILYGSLQSILHENHSVETLTVVFYIMAVVAWLMLSPKDEDYRRNWHIPVILALMAMRELDFDKRFTTEGILQLRLYSGPAPLIEKLIGAAVVILILICAFRLLLINVPKWLRGLKEGAATSWLVALAGVLLVSSKSLDGIGRKLEPFGIKLSQETLIITTDAEEFFELTLAMALVMAVLYYTRSRRKP